MSMLLLFNQPSGNLQGASNGVASVSGNLVAAAPKRYWVGDSGNWGDTAHWSLTPGGTGGASVPTSSDDVYFTADSFSASSTVTINTTERSCHNFDASGIDQDVEIASVGMRLSCMGSVVFSSRLTLNFTYWENFCMASNSTETLTFNGANFANQYLVKNGNGILNLLDTLDLAPYNGFESSFKMMAGTFNSNDHTITARHFDIQYSSVVNFGSSTIYISQIFYAPSAGCTLNAGTSHIIMNGVGQTFSSGGKTFYDLTIQGANWGGSGAEIWGSGTFHNLTFGIKNSYTTTIILFQANSIQTITGKFSAVGTAARPTQLRNSAGTDWNIDFDGTGIASDCDWLLLRDSNATPSATWFAGANSTDVGNNTGWTFTDAPVVSGIANGVSTVTGVLRGRGNLVSVINSTSIVTGAIRNQPSTQAGTIVGTSTVSGTLRGKGTLRLGAIGFGVAKVQQITITLSDSQTTNTGAVTGFTDLDRMVVFESHEIDHTTGSVYNAYSQIDAYASTINEITVSRGATATGQSVTITLFVVQFSPETTVQKGTYSMNTSTTIVDVSISTVITAETFLKHHISSTSEVGSFDGAPSNRAVAGFFYDSSTIRFQRVNASNGAVSGHWFVISHPDLEVVHGNFSTTGDVAYGITTIDPTNTFLLASNYSLNNTFNGEALWALWVDSTNWSYIITDSTYAGTGEVVYYQLIKHTGLAVQHPRFAAALNANDNSITITSVDLTRTVAIDTLRSEYVQQNNYEAGTLHRKFFRKTLDDAVTTSMSVTDRVNGVGVNVPWNIVQFPLAEGGLKGSSVVTGTLRNQPTTQSGTIVGTSTVSGTIQARGRLIGQINGVSVTTGTIRAIGRLIGNANGVALNSGTIRAKGRLITQVNGSSSVTATIRAKGRLAGLSTGNTLVYGTIYNGSPSGMFAISNGVSTITGTIRAKGRLVGQSNGTSVVSPMIHGRARIYTIVNGSSIVVGYGNVRVRRTTIINGYSIVSGTLRGRGFISGQTDGFSLFGGSISAKGTLSTTLLSYSQITGSLSGRAHISGTIDSSRSIVTALLTKVSSIEYSIDGINWQKSNLFEGLTTGTYTIQIRDFFGPITSVIIRVEGGGSFNADYSFVPVDNPSNKGILKFNRNVILRFTDLFDTFNSYLGLGGYFLKVKDTEDGITVSPVMIESDKAYAHEQSVLSNEWLIVHNLEKFPAVEIVDENGEEMIGEVQYIDENNLAVRFDYQLTGKVYCN